MIKFYRNNYYVEFIARKMNRCGDLLDYVSIDYPIYSDDSSTIDVFNFLNIFYMDILHALNNLGEYPSIYEWIGYNIVTKNNTKSGKININSKIDLHVISNNHKN